MPRRVLVVDDSRAVRKLVGWHIGNQHDLELCGEAADGAQGVAMALGVRPDVIILDQEMPVLDGLGALKQLRSAVPEATIVLFSSADDPTIRQRALTLGADAFFEKGPEAFIRLMSFVAG